MLRSALRDICHPCAELSPAAIAATGLQTELILGPSLNPLIVLAQFPNLASPALMFISNTAPINPQTVFLEPADDTNTPSRTVRSDASL